MDSLLILGVKDEKLIAFLEKLGYGLSIAANEAAIAGAVKQGVYDLVLIDSRMELDAADLCEYLAAERILKQVPMIVLGDEALAGEIRQRGLDQAELVELPYSVGSLVGRISTKLRLRKMAGAEESSASLGEINANLRELNARFTKQLEEARAIQQSLIPAELPGDERVDMALSYEPLEEVGGDWYFVRTTDSGKISVQIADVTGHGLSAAFIGSMTKLAMTAADREDPGELLTEMNRLMAPNIPPGNFVTMFAFLYDPDTGKLDYARAGHPPGLLVRRRHGEVEQLRGDGFAVGFFEDSEYSSFSTSVDPDDIVMVYTDAIPESQNLSGETYDYDRLSSLLLASDPALNSAEILTASLDDFDDFRQGRILKDDVTVLVLKRIAVE